jgi:hypothetical protein
MQHWFGSIKPTSTVHYIYPKSMYYRLRVVLVGELTEESTAELINHYYDHMGRPHVTTSLSTPCSRHKMHQPRRILRRHQLQKEQEPVSAQNQQLLRGHQQWTQLQRSKCGDSLPDWIATEKHS